MARHGSDLALETSDAVVVRDELAILPKVMTVSGRAHRIVKANLMFASFVIATLVIADLIWILPLPLGVAGHEGSTVVVGLNGLRILRRSVSERAGVPSVRQIAARSNTKSASVAAAEVTGSPPDSS